MILSESFLTAVPARVNECVCKSLEEAIVLDSTAEFCRHLGERGDDTVVSATGMLLLTFKHPDMMHCFFFFCPKHQSLVL